MKSVVAFVLACWMLGGSFLPGFGVDQTAHLGDLIEHYREHRSTDHNLSFIDFYKMHYGANSEHQKHPNHSHHSLPTTGHSVSVYTPSAIRLSAPLFTQVMLIATSDYFLRADLYSFLAVFALINPPRQ